MDRFNLGTKNNPAQSTTRDRATIDLVFLSYLENIESEHTYLISVTISIGMPIISMMYIFIVHYVTVNKRNCIYIVIKPLLIFVYNSYFDYINMVFYNII